MMVKGKGKDAIDVPAVPLDSSAAGVALCKGCCTKFEDMGLRATYNFVLVPLRLAPPARQGGGGGGDGARRRGRGGDGDDGDNDGSVLKKLRTPDAVGRLGGGRKKNSKWDGPKLRDAMIACTSAVRRCR